MIRKIQLFIVIMLSVPCETFAQGTFEDVYKDFKKQAQTEYEDFRKKVNKDYAEWMRKAWEWHDKIAPMMRPKDEIRPPVIFDKEQQKEGSKPLPHGEIIPEPEPEPQPKPIAPIKEYDGEYKVIYFQFFGTKGKVRLPNDFHFKIGGKNEEAYANAWEELSKEKYNNLIRDCLVFRMEHQLCDWAYLLMLGAMSDAVCGKDTNESVMIQAFVYCQSGYQIRLGLTQDEDLRLLFKSEHIIFDLTGFKMDDGVFYLLPSFDDEGLKVCDISYPEEKPLSLWITQEQKFAVGSSAERLFIPQDSLIAIKSQTNKNLIDFYGTYPTSMIGEDLVSRWAMYANTPLSNKGQEKLYPQLKSVIDQTDNNVIAANWLLYWIQTAFVYEYDDKVWGHDRAFFAEETLYYPYCDCEDRSILYTRLVRDLLDLNAILVYYPGHLAAAVEFNTPVEGDYINLDGKRFTICDPTYIGAPVGVTMPDMNNHTAKVVLLSK